MQRTRREILDILKRKGEATLGELAAGVGLVPVTVRAHLNVLERDDLVTYQEVRGRVGRPYYVYSLTDKAENHFPKSYHILANRLLDSLSAVGGRELTQQVVEHMAQSWAQERAARTENLDLPERIAEVARIRTEEGAWAEWAATDNGYLLTQYNCPIPHVATRHSDLVCAAELAYLRHILSADVERVLARECGADSCAYFVSAPAPNGPNGHST